MGKAKKKMGGEYTVTLTRDQIKEEIRPLAEQLADIRIIEKKKGLQIIPTRERDITGAMAVFTALNALRMANIFIGSRLHADTDMWRSYKLATSLTDKVAKTMLATFPEEKRKTMTLMKDHMNFRAYTEARKAARQEDGYTIIKIDNLGALVESAHDYRCLMCSENCRECDLGKALDECTPQTRGKHESWSMISVADSEDDRRAVEEAMERA